ncbi:imidazole glycerol phosphate synthase subunit HisH [Candidatus Peregrinibacteria bacterium CG10_big_fil_rev_8_21_14_0_10_42_8]|nr:MAG: imidazole glycerol phosphate synthase subunit HisH [Candidatus Peregrinibacteria bacterium CG10_big_fil_rev_8_21_14_0_10_42_8]
MSTMCIVDYGVGNIHSVMKALKLYTDNVILSENIDNISKATALVLPGQGSFAAGMDGLKKRGLIELIQKKAARGTPILGICLGAQLLLEIGYEFGTHEGLGILPGKVVAFPELQLGTKIPHMGWNSLTPARPALWEGTALKSLTKDPEMYFIHSYILQPSMREHIIAKTTYGGLTFPSVIGKDHILGCQFHPEKSSKEGLKIIENFVLSVEGT